ncbi:hypothetical protein BHE74_00016880 [Ensete ventricosum]|nr:hypothetical protein GW17_00025201 [Ensete ventricosum]RWW75113.1 hypothetical protein BHE74_00016880 [Ensete ventricosum]
MRSQWPRAIRIAIINVLKVFGGILLVSHENEDLREVGFSPYSLLFLLPPLPHHMASLPLGPHHHPPPPAPEHDAVNSAAPPCDQEMAEDKVAAPSCPLLLPFLDRTPSLIPFTTVAYASSSVSFALCETKCCVFESIRAEPLLFRSCLLVLPEKSVFLL